jgi:RND superfamily putative drug exporter
MFRFLGNMVSRMWALIAIGWVVALIALKVSVLSVTEPLPGDGIEKTSPGLGLAVPFTKTHAWYSVIEEGEFAFLPDEMPSLAGERVYEEAWGEPLASNIVIVVRRERTQLTESDRFFITDHLKPALAQLLEEIGLPQPRGVASPAAESESSAAGSEQPEDEDSEDFSARVKTFASAGWKEILDSADGRSTMVVIDLATEFFDARNTRLIDTIEGLITREASSGTSLYERLDESGEAVVPSGLDLALSGSATVGRDMMRAAKESSEATELWTVLLVVALLIVIYRAPVLAVIPLVTVAVATEFSLALLVLLAHFDLLGLFNGIEVYVKVLCYGAGVDYCLFLIARFKEELDEGQSPADGVSNALAKVGEALVASAGTVICGIGMMIFADFGKFRQAGVGISIGLVIVLIASLTLTPAMLRMAGRWAFWPHVATSRVRSRGGWVSATGLMAGLFRRNLLTSIWERTAEVIQRRPGFLLTVSTLAMLPFAVIAILCFNNLSYGLLTELPQDNASVQGARAIQSHYPAGIAGPVTLLLHNPEMDFSEPDAQEGLKGVVDSLYESRARLNLAEIRSVVNPFGIEAEKAREAADANRERSRGAGADSGSSEPKNPESVAVRTGLGGILNRLKGFGQGFEKAVEGEQTTKHYVAQFGEYAGHLTRLDLISRDDPFSRDSITQFVELRQEVLDTAVKVLAPSEPDQVEIFAIGPTASIRDLKTVTDRDQRVVDSLVLLGIFLILVVLLRQFTIPVYLIVSVFFSYLVTLGVTFAVFWALDPGGFTGLDWKVPTFLFTILIAVGEDYNIFLMTRIREEQVLHGKTKGVAVALTKTGSIISSCGIIMAGTFSSLLAGSLAGMHQLGFALAFGVLLDTFVVRPILVPAYLVLLYEGRLSLRKRLPGPAQADDAASITPAIAPASELKHRA